MSRVSAKATPNAERNSDFFFVPITGPLSFYVGNVFIIIALQTICIKILIIKLSNY